MDNLGSGWQKWLRNAGWFLATLVVLGNLLADVLLAVFDPRIRYG